MENQTLNLSTWITTETVVNVLIIGLIGVVIWLVLLGVYKLLLWILKSMARGMSRLLRGFAMKSKRKRQQQLASDLADVMTSFLEDQLFKGKVTKEDAYREYRIFTRNHGLWDCANPRFCDPPRPHEDVKEEIRKRLPATALAKLNGSAEKSKETQVVDPLAAALFA